MKLDLGILIFCIIHIKISCFQIDSQWRDWQNESMSTSIAQSSFESQTIMKTCLLYNGDTMETLETYLHLSDSNEHSMGPDPFLLKSCYVCLMALDINFKNNQITSSLDYRNKSQTNEACKFSNENCVKYLKMCCENALLCCIKQLKTVVNYTVNTCPMIWDGYTCIDETAEDVTFKMACPIYLPGYNNDNSTAEKHCRIDEKLSNYTNKKHLAWELSKYKICISTNIQKELWILGTKCCFLSISLCLLLLSLLIFTTFKSLRSQQRIKVHINLFITLSMRYIFELASTASNTMILVTDKDTGYLQGNICDFIIILQKYFQNSTFSWMLCEALLLHQLLFRTFEHRSGIKMYLFIGWCVPLLYTGIYFCIRKFHPAFKPTDAFICGVKELPKLEYVLRGPNILILLLNGIFLINIIRLIRNLPTQPYEGNDWKRTLKAVLVLVPLFGIQLLLVAFSLSSTSPFYLSYTIFQNIIQDSQGIAVSLAFCAFNQEVHKILHETFSFLQCKSDGRTSYSNQNRFNSRKHGSINSRTLQRSSNSIPLTVRDSVEHQFKLFKATSDKEIAKLSDPLTRKL